VLGQHAAACKVFGDTSLERTDQHPGGDMLGRCGLTRVTTPQRGLQGLEGGYLELHDLRVAPVAMEGGQGE